MARSSIDFDGLNPVYENETGARFSQGLTETQQSSSVKFRVTNSVSSWYKSR